jgi:Domain of unknown function (DUF6570)
MARCQFVYLRRRGSITVEGGQCEREAYFVNSTLCQLHHNKKNVISDERRKVKEDGSVSNAFPRTYTDEEMRDWVDEARRLTSPEHNGRRGCIVCGRLFRDNAMMAVTCSELKKLKELSQSFVSTYYSNVDASHFRYSVALPELDGLPLDRSGFLNAEELTAGSPFIGKACDSCRQAVKAGKVPNMALANGLWSGAGRVPELADLTWIEEKLIARVHVSIQLQKCRVFHKWRLDGFYPQGQLRGHILSFPVDPTVVLDHLPLAPEKLCGLVKVVFISQRKVTLSEASQLRFFIVRRQKVRNALEWLIEHNTQYEDVRLDYECLSRLPESGIMKEVFDQITFSNKVEADMAGHSRYDAEDEEDEGLSITFLSIR